MSALIIRVLAILLVLTAVVCPPAIAGSAPPRAPAFTLELFNGQDLRLADLKNKVVILLFWAEW
jgi:hypothetical protein